MEPYKLYWIEEPVETDDIEGSARVADALHTPIAGYETELGLYGFRELIRRGAVDIVQLDIAWSGGFSEGRRIAAYAQAHHRMVAPHAFAGAVLLVASLHFAAAIPNALMLEWDQNPNAAARRIAEGAAQARKRRHRQTAGAARPRHRARPRRGRALPGRVGAEVGMQRTASVSPAEAAGTEAVPALFTIGYEKARLADVIATLAEAGVATLIDVRDRPISRRPGFSQRQLEAAIEEAGMRYLSLRALGTPPEGREADRRRDWDRFWAIVETRLSSPEAELALHEAGLLAQQSASCLLCYEADWRVCHRRRVAELLAERHGFTVHHLTVADGAG